MKRPEAAACMVEDAVQDDPHAPGMGGVEQGPQGVGAAEQRVHLVVVVRVVAMVGR
jgi:hypothetical protein